MAKVSPKAWGAILGAAGAIAGGLIVKWEGTRYEAYRPVPGDPWTICVGHTRGVKEGDTATQEQCDAYLAEDMAIAAQTVSRCITYPLTVSARAALISGVFNIGPSLVCGSTLQRKANAGDIAGMCAELSRWVYAGGKRYRGLENRRADERRLCES